MVHPRHGLAAAPGVCLALLSLAGCTREPPTAPNAKATPQISASLAPGLGARRHVVVRKDGLSNDLRAPIEAAGGRVRSAARDIGVYSVEGLSDAAVTALSKRADVEGVAADQVVQWLPPSVRSGMKVVHATGLTPGVRTDQSGAFFFPFQWNLTQVKADQAWLVTKQGQGSLVCVLDTGIDPTHIDTQGKVDETISASFVEGEAPDVDFFGHGTFVASLISSNGLGMASVAPDAVLCSQKVLDRTGSGSFADVISGIFNATIVGADVINMSLGAYFSRNEDGAKELIRAMQRAVNFAHRRGVLVVAASGNDGVNFNKDPKDFIEIPAELVNVLSVGATGPTFGANFDGIPSYSNVGRSGVDVFAPGGGDAFVDEDGNLLNPGDLILGACSPSIDAFACSPFDYLIGNGTSFAAPHASGEGAVIESNFPRDQRGDLLSACITLSADKVTGRFSDPIFAFGRINVLKGAFCRPSFPLAKH